MPKPDAIEDLPPELQAALATIQNYQQEHVHGSTPEGGFDVANYLQLSPEEKYMPIRHGHTQMERTIPGKGTFPMFDPNKVPVYREYPKMLYGLNGEQVTVASRRAEEAAKAKTELYDHPDELSAALASDDEDEAEVAEAPKRKAGRPAGSGRKHRSVIVTNSCSIPQL